MGDPAPAIPDIRWVGGELIPGWKPGHLYVIDFWATWCPPCIKGLRHLQTLHEELGDRDVHIVAIALVRLEDGEAAQKIANTLLTGPQGNDHYPLFILATRIVINLEETPPDLRDLDLALQSAEKAVKNNPTPEYDYLALLADVHALRGEYEAAVRVQRQAGDLASDAEKQTATKTLEDYGTRAAGR